MRLVGYWFDEGDGPLKTGWLPFGSLTVLFGANDAGKSRLLRQLDRDLQQVERLARGESPSRPLIFVKLTAAEADELLALTYVEAHPGEPDRERVYAVGGRRAWLERLNALDQGHPGAEEVNRALQHSTLFGLEPLGTWCGQGLLEGPGLLLHWCLPSRRQLEPWLAAALAAYEGARGYRPLGLRAGPPDEAPTLVSAMGTITTPLLPVAIRLPLWETDLVAEAVNTVGRWIRARRAFLRTRTWAGGDPVRWHAALLHNLGRPADPGSEWLDGVDGPGARIADDATAALTLVSRAAQDAMVPFAAARYRIALEPAPLTSWEARGALRVVLRPRSAAAPIPLEDAADGLRLWAQLAVAEGLDRLRLGTLSLQETWSRLAEEVLDMEQGGQELAEPWLRRRVEAVVSGLEDAKTPLRDPGGLNLLREIWAAAQSQEDRVDLPPAPPSIGLVREARSSIYLLDEPERHLNPKLQREAAEWLASLLERRRSQAVIATHSVAFIGAPEGTQFAHVLRKDEESRLEPLSADEITATSDLAAELGLDRGELLATVRVVLFCEGQADRAVLEEAFGARLRRAGVLVVPLGGLKGASQIIEMDVLVRYCGQRLAVVLDQVTAPEASRLASDRNYRRQVHQNRRAGQEVKALANLLDRAEASERRLHAVPLPVPDIFDALDEMILSDRYPKFPGHLAARQDAEQAQRDAAGAGRKPPHWKAIYRERYEIEMTERALGEVAALMRQLNRVSQPLSGVWSALERLSSEPSGERSGEAEDLGPPASAGGA